MQAETGQRGIGYGPAVFSAAVIAVMVYLTFAAVQGEYGLFRLFQVEGQERQLARVLVELSAERERLANLTGRLSTGALDADLLEERARAVLGLVHRDEIVIR
jgi:cell division protein FtsB